MKTLPVTVLVSEGPMARAYLSRMRFAGFRPQRLILLVNQRHPVTKRPMFRWLPSKIRTWYLEKAQELAYNFWPRRIRSSHRPLMKAMVQKLSVEFTNTEEVIEDIMGKVDYRASADEFRLVRIDNLSDPQLVKELHQTCPSFFIFTGGGIVPERLLDIPDARFLHIHPGFLPYVRGADGLLWSTLVRKRPGATSFFLAKGIDVGDIVAAADFAPLEFDLRGSQRPDDETLYRATFSFYDPLLRAEMLIRTLRGIDWNLNGFGATRQDASEGITYHFMHDELKRVVLQKMFRS